MRILFMGTPDFAVPSLEALVAAGHEVVGVFSQPDSISCLRLNSPAERETLPPVNEPPALTTWPSTVTTRLR